MNEAEARAAVLVEARTWISTPYRHRAMIKGAGVDCMTLLVAAARGAGLLLDYELPKYSAQFGQNRSAETYIAGLGEHCREVDSPKPGDVAIWQFGRVFSHGAIVVEWPRIIHAQNGIGVIEDDAERSVFLNIRGADPRPRRFFSYW